MEENILEIAKEAILAELETLQLLHDDIGEDFTTVVKKIFECKGRIIITGIGKSALIAQKMVATFNSTGTRSIYMHAGDALHGDLGMVTSDDLLMCLSKSGQTAEFKLLIPMVQSQGTPVIAISSNESSHLMVKADYRIYIPLNGEAEPNNIIPTSSTTAQMALGDAMAVALLKLRGFTMRDFANFHPGGSIGKELFLKVEEIADSNALPQVCKSDTLSKAILEMTGNRLGATAVVDDQQKVLGIITDGDLRRMLQDGGDVNILKVEDIMSKDPITVQSGSLAYKAFQIMRSKSISQIIISEHGIYKGMIHIHDFLKEGFI